MPVPMPMENWKRTSSSWPRTVRAKFKVSESPLYQEPVGWSPDGSRLFYAQFGTSPTLWAVPIANGHAQGPPVSLREFNTHFNAGVQFLAMTARGTLYYRERVSGADLYIASMDPVSGSSLPSRGSAQHSG